MNPMIGQGDKMLPVQHVFIRGQQIAYLPNHVLNTIYGNEDLLKALGHKDVEFGFVTSQHSIEDAHFCRYWLKDTNPPILRNASCSELTPTENLIKYDKVDQKFVDQWLNIDDAGGHN